MHSRTLPVGSAVGLHARPAALIAAAANEYDTDVTLALPGQEPVDACSALMIMTLGAQQGDLVEVSGEDPAAVEAIAGLVARNLDA